MRRALLFLAVLLIAAGGQALEVRIVQPPTGQPLLGEVEVRVEVLPPGTPVERVEILLDGKPAGTAEQAPYRLRIDAGEEGHAHRLEAVAYGTDGSRASALLAAPPLEADARIQVDLQQLFVTVESGGHSAIDLGRDDFTVLDQGVPQPIVTFGRGDVPFTAALLVDSSDSMYGGDLEKALEGARAFFAAMSPLDQAKLMLFSDHVRLETPFTSVQPVLTLGLRGVEAAGGTAINDALYLAVKRLETRRGRKIAVLLSDGIDVESVLSISEARAIARRQVTLYWLRLPGGGRGQQVQSAWRGPAEHEREIEQLRAAVLESGGRVLDLAGVDQIPATLTTLLRELRDQYVLGIVPHTGSPGARHEIKVQVKGGAEARTQDGYFEP